MRAFARPGDRLWTPAPVARERLVELPGLPLPELESGPLAAAQPAAQILAWGETAEVGALRSRGPVVPARPGAPPLSSPLWERLWDLPAAPAHLAARAQHRAFALEIARDLEVALPGARLVASPEELRQHLADGGALSSPSGRWVVKAPWSAAGRSRLIAPAPDPSAPKGRGEASARHLHRLFEAHGSLLFEPWMERRGDFGACALLEPSGWRLLGFHRLLTSSRGQPVAIELGTDEATGLSGEERRQWERVLEAVASALTALGYRGPFGVDAWRYLDADGALHFHPLGELNARLTFGLLTRALAQRLGEELGWAPRAPVRLVFGTSAPGHSRVLLHPGEEGEAGAWLEAPSPESPETSVSS